MSDKVAAGPFSNDVNLDRDVGDCATILLAGGQGTRLHELTKEECKPAVSFLRAGRIVDFVMASAVRSRLNHIIVATQYRPDVLSAHLTEVWETKFANGLKLRDGSRVGKSGYQGTADAVRANLAEIDGLSPKYLLVLSGDHILDMDFSALIGRHRDSQAHATVAVTRVSLSQAKQFGIFETNEDGDVIGFAEKPARARPIPGDGKMALASMGIYVFDWQWLRAQLVNRPSRHDFGHDILPLALAENSLRVDCLPNRPDGSPGYWRDVGTLDSYLEAQIEFANPLAMPCRLPHRYPALNAGKLVGTRSIAQRGARIPESCRLTNAIVAEGTILPPGLVVGEDVAADSRWFRRSEGGTTLITPEMAARWREDHPSLFALSA